MIIKLNNCVFDVREVLYFKRELHNCITVLFKDHSRYPLIISFDDTASVDNAFKELSQNFAKSRNVSFFKRIFGFSLF